MNYNESRKGALAMPQTIEAIYDGSVLRPETALGLKANTRVRLTLEVLASDEPPATVRTLDPEALQPRDEWERGLLAAARDCGVSLSNEAVSSEGLYD
jgi:predicted DNA-binding antitoxin AbrB/MazE fold protein